jgi:hypothetical protein
MPEDQEHLFEKILELALKDKLVLWAGAVKILNRPQDTGRPTHSFKHICHGN